MSNEIPPTDPDLESLETVKSEFDLLEVNAKLERERYREAGQRYWLRWIALGFGVIVIFGMAVVLWRAFTVETSSVGTIIAPIVSITTITVTIFVAAFRKFEAKNLDTVGGGVTRGATMLRGE